MRKRLTWGRIAFWSLCAWCSWVLAVRGQEPGESRISFETVEWTPPKVIVDSGPATPATERRLTAPAQAPFARTLEAISEAVVTAPVSTFSMTPATGSAQVSAPLVVPTSSPASLPLQAPIAANCDPKTRQPLEQTGADGAAVRRFLDARSIERCIQILAESRIESDRLRALAMLEGMPNWPMVPGALPVVRRVLFSDYNVQMRAGALRMMTSIPLPPQTVAPMLAATARFDGSPELRQVARAMLEPAPMTMEQTRTMIAAGMTGNVK